MASESRGHMKPWAPLSMFKDMGFNDIVLNFARNSKPVTQKNPRQRTNNTKFSGSNAENPERQDGVAYRTNSDDFAAIRPKLTDIP